MSRVENKGVAPVEGVDFVLVDCDMISAEFPDVQVDGEHSLGWDFLAGKITKEAYEDSLFPDERLPEPQD